MRLNICLEDHGVIEKDSYSYFWVLFQDKISHTLWKAWKYRLFYYSVYFQIRSFTKSSILHVWRMFPTPLPKETFSLYRSGLINCSQSFNKLRNFRKQSLRGVLIHRFSENTQQIYMRAPMLNRVFNKFSKQPQEGVFKNGCFEICGQNPWKIPVKKFFF